MTDLAIPRRNLPMSRLPDSGMTVIEIAQHLAASGFFAETRDVSQAVAKILAGAELGIGPLASVTGIHVIKGKVAIGANLIASLIKSSGRYDYRVREFTDQSCTIEGFERGESLGTSSFTVKEAERAGLTAPSRNGEPSIWTRYPKNMLFARAISNLVRWYMADLTTGPIYMPEELGAVIDGETGEVISLPSQPAPPPPIAPLPQTDPAPPQKRVAPRHKILDAYAEMLAQAAYLQVEADLLQPFREFDAAGVSDEDLKLKGRNLRALVELRRMELEDAPAEEKAEERHRTLDAKMDRASADEDPR